MAGDWIKMRVALTYDLKVMQIARLLNGDVDFLEQLAPNAQLSVGHCNAMSLHTLVIGALHKFWCATQEITSDGNLGTLDENDINCLVGCYGFAESLLEVGWLEKNADGTLQVHNWDEHNGESAKKRAMGNKRVGKHRDVKRDCVTTVKRESVTREEKRREEDIPKGISISDAEKLYQIYPRHSGHKAAIAAIKKALSVESFAVLESAVTEYAKARAGEPEQFTPHPATWFNQERWKDDRQTWKPRAVGNGTAQSAARHIDTTQRSRIEEIMASATTPGEVQ